MNTLFLSKWTRSTRLLTVATLTAALLMSGFSAVVGAATAPGLLAPTNLSAKSVTGSSLELNWKNPLDNTSVIEYEVYQGATLLTKTAETKATLSGLTNASTYALAVKACEGEGVCSPLSTSINVRTLDTEKPTKPVKLYVSNITTNSFRLNWETSIDNVGVAGYKVYIDDILYEDVNKRHSYVTGLSANTSYSIKVLGYDEADNESDFSVTKTAKTFAVGGPIVDTIAPSMPTNLASNGVTSTGFTINWTRSTDNVYVLGYNIYRNGKYITSVSGNSYTFVGLTPNSAHQVRILAYDVAKNRSALTSAINVTTSP
jgi:chitodextrinase